MHGAVQVSYKVRYLGAFLEGEKAACHVVDLALATFALALLLEQQVLGTLPSLKDIL